jgi:hypothetical protein
MFELDKLDFFPKILQTVRFANCLTHLYYLLAESPVYFAKYANSTEFLANFFRIKLFEPVHLVMYGLSVLLDATKSHLVYGCRVSSSGLLRSSSSILGRFFFLLDATKPVFRVLGLRG